MPAALGDFASPFSAGAVANALPAAPAAVSAVHSAGIDWLLVCTALWSLGTIAVGAYWMVRWLRLRAAVRSATPLDLASPIPALSLRMPNEPGVAGLFRPVLLLPEGICDRLSPAQMRVIVAHEMCHVRRRDNLTATIHMLVEAIFWFHPLVWWIGRRMIGEREAACDEAVIAAGGEREAYAEALLTVCKFYVESPLASAAGVAGADLKKRIERIMTPGVTQQLNFAKKAMLAVAATATVVAPIAIASLFAIPTGTLAQGHSADSATFQNVTIHAGEPGAMDMLFSVGQSRFEFTGSLRQLIASGFDVESALVSGPEMLDARYTVEATVPGGSSWPGYSSIDTGRGMVRNMLADQFQLQVHRNAQSMPVYVLSSGGANVLMKVASPAEPGPGVSVGLTSISGTSLRMDDFIDLLSQRLVRPVLDQTGLKQTYDFQLDWKVNVTPGTAETLPRPTPEVLADALQTQLGLTLQPATAPAEVLVVDHVSQPKALVPVRTAVQTDPTTFDAYAGRYVFGSGVVNIYRDGGRYFSQLPGQQAIEIFPDAQGEFFTKVVDAQITFDKDASGNVTELVLHQGGRDISMPRVDEATAKQMTDALSAKLRQKTATPGSDEALAGTWPS